MNKMRKTQIDRNPARPMSWVTSAAASPGHGRSMVFDQDLARGPWPVKCVARRPACQLAISPTPRDQTRSADQRVPRAATHRWSSSSTSAAVSKSAS
jgi:hypothetical protein